MTYNPLRIMMMIIIYYRDVVTPAKKKSQWTLLRRMKYTVKREVLDIYIFFFRVCGRSR